MFLTKENLRNLFFFFLRDFLVKERNATVSFTAFHIIMCLLKAKMNISAFLFISFSHIVNGFDFSLG